ncbi:MAG: hypothetical protein HOJ90_03165 [Alphaproteobacteria bacterium]|jgi:hypothetical protein|nr:hypothetical protein [Alphaproteobacteria bacterium]
MNENEVLILDSVTKFERRDFGKVAIAASHGGAYAGYLAARVGIRGVILHDAGIGKDQAGISALPYLDGLSIAGATIDYRSARIGDGQAMAETGLISHVNQTARQAGCGVGQTAMICAMAMRTAKGTGGEVPGYAEARFVLHETPGAPKVIGCDSTSLVKREDEGQIVVTASHGDLLRESPSWGARPDVLAAIFNDAGSDAPSRLPDLDTRAITGATVSSQSARIGDARSTFEDGIISHINKTARKRGAYIQMSCKDFVRQIIDSSRGAV